VVAGKEIYYSIKKSKTKNKSKKLLLGDSVANQLFDNKSHNDTINSLACNQSIGLVGQYILLNNYLNAGNKIDTAYFILQPFSFLNNLDQVYTYHYFLKPFYNREYEPYFTSTVRDQISKIPYSRYCWYPSILTSNWAPDFKSEDEKKFSFLSPISVDYIKKIKELAFKNNFKLVFLPTPVSLNRKKDVDKFNRTEIAQNGFQNEFEGYFDRIIYLDDDNFVDGSHLHDPKKYSDYYISTFLK
jgi:hypothetical protein